MAEAGGRPGPLVCLMGPIAFVVKDLEGSRSIAALFLLVVVAFLFLFLRAESVEDPRDDVENMDGQGESSSRLRLLDAGAVKNG